MNSMSNNNTVLVKTILDKTGLNKGIKEFQSNLARNPLKIPAALDTKTALKNLQPLITKINKQFSQNPVPLKYDLSGISGSSKQLPEIIQQLTKQFDTENLGKCVQVHIFQNHCYCFENALHA